MKFDGPAAGWLIGGAALALRVGWVVYRWVQGGPAFEFADESLHWQLAANLVQSGELISDDGRLAARMPLYPLLLALFAWLGQGGILVVRLGQALLGAATTLLAYRFARTTLGPRAALVAGVLVCCDPYAIFFANLLLTEVSFTLIGLGLTACAWHIATRPDRATRGALLGVALLGAAVLMTRPSAAGWVLALWVVLWLADRRRGRGTLRLLAYAATLVIFMLPWGLRNHAVLGSYAWLSANGGVTLYDAQGPQADGSSDQAFLNELPELKGLGEIERDRTLRRLALEQMRADPARVLRLALTKFGRTWNLVPNQADYRRGYTAFISAVFTGLVLLLAAVGLWRTLAIKPRASARAAARPPDGRRSLLVLHLLLWLPVVYFTLVHCVFVGSLRYRVPLMPLLEIAGAAAFCHYWRRARCVRNSTRALSNGSEVSSGT